MAKKRKVRRSISTAVLLWLGRRLLARVQKRSLRSITQKPKPERRSARVRGNITSPAGARPPHRRGRRAGKGFLVALLSAAAVAAIKVGVNHVIEAEREQHVVVPDFDVFADDDE